MLNRGDELLRNHPGVAKWMLVLCTVVAYGGMLGNGFVLDDGKQVLENPFVHNPHLWHHIFTGSVASFTGASVTSNFYRPLHIFSYWLAWQVAGANPVAFHLYQLIFYIITILLIYRLGRRILPNHLTAFAGALLWALHPLHVEPVCWIAGVPDCGCALFFLWAMVIFLRAEKAPERRWAWHALGATVYFPALLFKEMAISLPLLLAVYWWVMADAESWWRKGLRWLPYAAATAIYLVIRIAALGHASHAPHLWKLSPSVAEAAVGLLGQHTKLFFWPTHLNNFRDFNLAASLRSPWPWITLLVIGLAVGLRKHDSTWSFLTLWWPVTLLPCLDVRQLSTPLLADRFSYLPSVGLSLAVAYFALHTLPERFRGRRPARALVPAFGLTLVLLSVQDLRAVPRWRDNDALWNYSYQVAPQSGLVHIHRALDLQFRENDLAGATREYELAMQVEHGSFSQTAPIAYSSMIGLGQIANAQGRTDKAIGYFQRAVKIMPHEIAAYALLGSVYFPQRDYARAAEYFQQAVNANPMDMLTRYYLGTCWMKLGKPAQAAEQFHAAREIDPEYSQAYVAEAGALEAAGDKAGAARVRGEMPSH